MWSNNKVILTLEHGLTFASSDEDAFALNAPISGGTKNATIKGSPVVLRSLLGYSAASRAAQGGQQAFMDATKFLVANMLRSMAKALEIEMLYGQAGLGTVASIDGTNTIVTVTTAQWAPGIWAGSENMVIEIRNSTGSVVRGTASIIAVNMEARTLTLSTGILNVVANDVIWRQGAYGNEFIGIHQIVNGTADGSVTSLFGINCSQYTLFRGNRYDAQNGALSFTKLNLAAARAVEKGLDGKLVAFVNPRAWANMLSDQAALRKYDGSYDKSKLENGSQAITFFSQNGEIKIVPSIYVKEGFAYLLSIEDWVRVGSSDMSFKRPGAEGNFFRDLDNAAGYELRLFSDQAVFTFSPAKNVVIFGITNQA